jgi:hypothetical protein
MSGGVNSMALYEKNELRQLHAKSRNKHLVVMLLLLAF